MNQQQIFHSMTVEQQQEMMREAVRQVLSEFLPPAGHVAPPDEPEMLSRIETAARLNYSPTTVSRNYAAWGLTPLRRGRDLFFFTKQVEDLKRRLFQTHGAGLPKETR